jgi:hypothetical protein
MFPRQDNVGAYPPYTAREDEMAYLAGWTISGLATLGTILAVWIFAV